MKRLSFFILALCCLSAAAQCWAEPQPVNVDYEYGRLREVVVGVPFTIAPDLTVAKWAQETIKILPKPEAEKLLAMSGKDSLMTGLFQQLEKENKELIGILERHGVKVLRPDILNRERVALNFGDEYIRFGGVSQQYTRDPVTVVGDNVIENTMGSLYRRSDILGLVRLLRDRLDGTPARWVSMPALDYSLMVKDNQFDKTGFPVLEGGDVIVLGKKIFVGTSANSTTGSSEKGYLWLKNYLAPQGYDVERVRLPDDVLHLDVALSVPKPGVIVVCPDAFLDGIPHYFDGWKRIPVTKEETRYLATNGLPIDQENYIMGVNGHFDSARIKKELESAGIKVHTVFFESHTRLGGSIRCSTMPLRREIEAKAK